MIKSFSGQVVFCFVILRTISAYVDENWLSQYSFKDIASYKFTKIRWDNGELPVFSPSA